MHILFRVFQKILEPSLCSFSCSKMNENAIEYIFFIFRTHHGNKKNETHGVSFKLFSRSIKTKILTSDLVLFMLVKVFEENV
jgi:hypothetical protein